MEAEEVVAYSALHRVGHVLSDRADLTSSMHGLDCPSRGRNRQTDRLVA
jgi:hypothetical protein